MNNLVIEAIAAYAKLNKISLDEAKNQVRICEHAQEIVFKLACAAAAQINA